MKFVVEHTYQNKKLHNIALIIISDNDNDYPTAGIESCKLLALHSILPLFHVNKEQSTIAPMNELAFIKLEKLNIIKTLQLHDFKINNQQFAWIIKQLKKEQKL